MNKTVFITGATSGIGKETAVKFAKAGWNLVCHYFSSDEKGQGLKKVIENYGVDCRILKCDFSSREQILGLIAEASGLGIDSLINNAGTYLVNKHFNELALEDLNTVFMINVFSPILLTSGIFTRMKEKGFGRIVNVSSIAAKYGGSSFSLPYGSSKMALEGLTKTVAKEGAAYNVLVNTVRPGVIDTDFHKKFPKDMDKRIDMIPLKKMGNPLDVAEMIYFLASEKNNFITNEIFTVAGGE